MSEHCENCFVWGVPENCPDCLWTAAYHQQSLLMVRQAVTLAIRLVKKPADKEQIARIADTVNCWKALKEARLLVESQSKTQERKL